MPSMPIRSSQAARASSGRAAVPRGGADLGAAGAAAFLLRAARFLRLRLDRRAMGGGRGDRGEDGPGEGGPGGEMAREIGGRHLPHMADAQREDQPGQRDAAFLVDRIEKVRRRFLAPALAVLQLLQTVAVARLQREDVRRLRDPAIA
jgi:hypothetical protein